MTFRKGLTLWLTFLILLFPAYLVADTAGDPSAGTTDDPTQEDTGYDPNGAGDSADGSDVEEPTYSNAAQAMHAANLAEAASAQPNEATKEAAENLDSAREAYDTSRKESLADPENPELVEAMQVAEKELEQARETYADRVGELAGVMGEEIQTMRQDKMGWGQIAHELGVHPGTLGLGHTKHKGALDPVAGIDASAKPDDPDAEIAEATRRDPKTGWNSGHGMAAAKSGSSKKGIGLPETSAAVSSTTPGKAVGKDKSSQSKSSGAQSSQNNSSAAASSSTQSNSGRAADGGPSNSNKGGNSGNEKNDKSGQSNNGNGNKKN